MSEKLNENDELRARIQELEDQVNKLVNLLNEERTRRTDNMEEFTDDVDPFAKDMVLVEGGTFTMGDDDSIWDEPAHQVTLSDFHISKYEVTQKQWIEIMGDNPSRFKGDNLPVENVSWDKVQEFIQRLNTKTGMNYRLPTEAEWEYAARGGNKSRGYKYSGSNMLDDVAWYGDVGVHSQPTHPVGQKKPNELGLYDMSGNVWEWCSDWYGDYGSGSQTNPKGPSDGVARVLRGGSSRQGASCCLVSFRYEDYPDHIPSEYRDYGFRLARSCDENDEFTLEKEVALKTQVEEERKAKEEAERRAREEEARKNDPFANDMVYVQGGTFTMGATSEQGSDASDKEKPTIRMAVSDFYISKYEVTQKQWVEIMGKNPSRFKGDNLPVVNVSWNDIQRFIKKLNAKTGKNYRLPTEAEWEYAARGGNKSKGYKYSGSNTLVDVAWYCGNSKETHPVGQKKPNELGLYDMSGNVYEWCLDYFDYESGSSQISGTEGSRCYPVRRGGSYGCSAEFCRVSHRRHDCWPGYTGDSIGFRLAHPDY